MSGLTAGINAKVHASIPVVTLIRPILVLDMHKIISVIDSISVLFCAYMKYGIRHLGSYFRCMGWCVKYTYATRDAVCHLVFIVNVYVSIDIMASTAE